MICQRCIRLLSQPTPHSTAFRTLTTTSGLLYPESPPPATSTSAAQPFSTPFTPSPAKTPGIPSSPSTSPKAAKKGSARPPSSVPAGTPLRGLGYIKGQEGPVAKEDSEYPDWLWGLLDGKRNESEEGTAGDAFAKSKKQRRIASKAARALKTGGISPVFHVPLEEQSIDLPAGMGEKDGERAFQARGELKKAMRMARKKKIKEDNFLRAMR